MGALPAPWVASPGAALVSLHAAAIAGGVVASVAIARTSTPRALWTGTWLTWSALGVVTAVVAPGASYLFVVPALAAGVFGFVSSIGVAAGAPVVVAAVVLAAPGIALYETLGFVVPLAIALPTALLVTTFSPLWCGLPRTGRSVPLFASAIAVLSALVASVTSPFSTTVRQRVNVVLRQDDGQEHARTFVDTNWGPTRWGDAPVPMKHVLVEGSGATRLEAPGTIFSGAALSVESPRVEAPPPDLAVLSSATEGSGRRVRVHVRSKRGAPTLMIRLPESRNVQVSVCPRAGTGVECARASQRFGMVRLRGLPTEGMDLELFAPGDASPIALELLDQTFELPAGSLAARVAAARPSGATPFQDGDVTVMAKSFAP
jgi:hypothetical protein